MEENLNVSVITPFYKGNLYLKQLFTVIENNYKVLKTKYPLAKLELILVNDSPETIVDIPNYPIEFQYNVINHENNTGIHQARVTGLNACTGELILFLDQDDILADNALLIQVDKMLKDEADIVICNAYMERADSTSYLLYKTKTDYRRINDLEFYLKSHNVIKSPGQCLIKKEIIPIEWKKYIMRNNGSDDLFLWILLLEQSYRFIVNKDPLYVHKYTGENLSDSEIKMSKSSLEIVNYLNQIKYVPANDVRILQKSREFFVHFYQSNIVNKVKSVVCNLDLVSYLVKNKVKRVMSRSNK